MPNFRYAALDSNGRLRNGTAIAETPTSCKRDLRAAGLVVMELTELRGAKKSSERGRGSIFAPRLHGIELAIILRQLATLLDAGLPLDDSLQTMAENSESNRTKTLLEGWLADLMEGESLAQAMRRGSQGVSDSIVAATEVAERTGHLAGVLERLADEQERSLDNQRALKGALIYPALLITVSLAALVFVVTNIIPKISAVFVSQKSELPFVTEVVLGVSDFFIEYGVVMGIALLLTAVGFIMALQRPSFRLRVDALLLRLPKVGYWIKLSDFSDWTRNLALMLESGVPVVDALRIANFTVSNRVLRAGLSRVVEEVNGGESLSSSLATTAEVPKFMAHLISSGEKSGQLRQMLDKIASYYSKLLASSTETLLKILNPALLIIIAGIITVIILGVITPIMQMNSMI